MYSKEITHYIVYCWGKGLTAEETVQALDQYKGVKVGLATVYRHRHNLTAHHLIDELLRQQQRDISSADTQELKLKFRNELLKILIPQRIESYQKQDITSTKEYVHRFEGLTDDERHFLELVARKYIKAVHKGESSSIH